MSPRRDNKVPWYIGLPCMALVLYLTWITLDLIDSMYG